MASGQVLDVAELAEPAAVAGDQHGPAAPDAIHEERLVVPRIERPHDVGRPHDGDGLPVLPMPLEQHVLAGDLVAGIVAPVESTGRLLGVGDGERVVVDAGGRDEDGVRAARQGVEQRGHVLAQRGRVGDVEDAVEALATEPLAQAGVILAIAGDSLYTSREALAAPPAVEHGDLMASRQERLHEV